MAATTACEHDNGIVVVDKGRQCPLCEAQARIDDLEKQVEAKADRIGELEGDIEEKDERIDELEKLVAAKQDQLDKWEFDSQG